ncbi:MAG: glycosyltransferase [Tannerella sp.]|jgi:glycosyltransferase involved in cell wall biosynthesis|nr:glycosyltransferase [Tannerella sp.]
MKSLITVITVVRNCSTTIEQTILSVLNQSYPNLEYILIDGTSTDGTLDIINNYDSKVEKGEFPNVTFRWLSESDNGIYDAMNKGIDLATGKWINFMNCGDRFFSNEVLMNIFGTREINSNIDIIYGDTVIDSQFGKIAFKSLPLCMLDKRMVFSHQSAFVRLEYMKQNKFNLYFKSSGDYNFFYNAYKSNVHFLYIPEIVSSFDRNENGISCYAPLVWREDAHIWDIDKTVSFWIIYIKDCTIWYIKRLIKRILPHIIVNRINKRNFNKLYQQHNGLLLTGVNKIIVVDEF